ncbi:helix-turn-helix domain-containing protein [Bdellovibrio sp. HCB337]|uniref:helix-turn-helix domain-containing protein n=1 Tax=Bdellovibrio sp. HCB337 TaxID=3394358 RepID=UPI0039A4AF85
MTNPLKLNIKKKSETCIAMDAVMTDFSGKLVCTMPGLEFLMPPYPAKEVYRDGKARKVDPQAVLVFNGTEEHVEVFQQTNTHLKSLVFGSQFVTDFCKPIGINATELLFDNYEISGDLKLQNLLRSLAALHEEDIPATEFSIDCLASEIMTLVLTKYKHRFSDKVHRGLSSGHFPSHRDRTKVILREHLDDPDFSMDTLAREVGLSKFHMIRSFTQETGTSPAKYLNKMKMEIAKQQLLLTPKSIISIANDLGFRDLSTFNKAFKNSTGLSPRNFRKQQ